MPKKTSTAKPKTVAGYLSALSSDKRAALEKLRKNIKAAAPGAEDVISYQIPAFRLDGRMLVWYGAWEKHCALYPGTSIAPFRKDLERFDTGQKGTIRFQPDHPLPAALVRKIVRARIAQNADRKRKGDAAKDRARKPYARRLARFVG